MSTAAKKYAWMLVDWEFFREPDYDTVESALDAAARYALSEGYGDDPTDPPRANVGEVTTAHDWLRKSPEWTGGRVAEMLDEGISEDLGAEEPVFDLTQDERVALGRHIAEWFVEHGRCADFYGVEHYTTHDLWDRMMAIDVAGQGAAVPA